VQSPSNRRQINAVVDGDGLQCGALVNIVYGAQTDGHTQQIIHEFHDTAHRGVGPIIVSASVTCSSPSFGDRQREQYLVLVVCLRRRKEVIQRDAGLVHLPVDQRTTHAVPGGQGADRFRDRQSPNGHHLAFVGSQFYGGSANG
jgi:hypothetical protein